MFHNHVKNVKTPVRNVMYLRNADYKPFPFLCINLTFFSLHYFYLVLYHFITTKKIQTKSDLIGCATFQSLEQLVVHDVTSVRVYWGLRHETNNYNEKH